MQMCLHGPSGSSLPWSEGQTPGKCGPPASFPLLWVSFPMLPPTVEQISEASQAGTRELMYKMHAALTGKGVGVHKTCRTRLHIPARQQFHSTGRARLQICRAAATVTKGAPVKQAGGVTLQGTSRKRNEDRFALQAST